MSRLYTIKRDYPPDGRSYGATERSSRMVSTSPIPSPDHLWHAQLKSDRAAAGTRALCILNSPLPPQVSCPSSPNGVERATGGSSWMETWRWTGQHVRRYTFVCSPETRGLFHTHLHLLVHCTTCPLHARMHVLTTAVCLGLNAMPSYPAGITCCTSAGRLRLRGNASA
ncbi:hypothetical protein C8Q80DRAFT_1135501 [Daedaleopsis nitida]|nr:hypothetical protein C8Q80DRAFT_1135501 [Daedaleopsis nitida]